MAKAKKAPKLDRKSYRQGYIDGMKGARIVVAQALGLYGFFQEKD